MKIIRETESDLAKIAEKAEQVSRLMAHLSNPGRLRVLCALSEGPSSVGDLAEALSMAQPTLSQHLARLREAELVSSTRHGTTVTNRLSDPRLSELMGTIYRLYCA